MKQLAFFLVLITVLGVGGFLYRNVMEQPGQGNSTACTLEARICPDGTSVGRSGPDCAFAACPLPNIEIPEAGIAFVLPQGYTQILAGGPTQPLRIFSKPSRSPSVEHALHISRYDIPEGQTAEQVILAHTRYQPADMPAEDFSRFTNVTIAGKTYRVTVIERFEALVQSSYFLVRANDVIRFDVLEHDVSQWTDPELVVENLPEHQALIRLLGTLQSS